MEAFIQHEEEKRGHKKRNNENWYEWRNRKSLFPLLLALFVFVLVIVYVVVEKVDKIREK